MGVYPRSFMHSGSALACSERRKIVCARRRMTKRQRAVTQTQTHTHICTRARVHTHTHTHMHTHTHSHTQLYVHTHTHTNTNTHTHTHTRTHLEKGQHSLQIAPLHGQRQLQGIRGVRWLRFWHVRVTRRRPLGGHAISLRREVREIIYFL
jgi:glycogen debranching enzyme